MVFTVLIFVIGFGLWFFLRPSKTVRDKLEPSQQHSSPANNSGTASTATKQQPSSRVVTQTAPSNNDAIMEYLQKTKADPQYDGKQPINFYGRVVDESNNPIEGASISFSWRNLSPDEHNVSATSDNNGFFSLTSQTGNRLEVTVSKKGYYSSGNARYSAYEYANPAIGLFKPDSNNPVVFHLRKKGVGVNLITSQHGIYPDLQIHIPRDGASIAVDLLQKKVSDSGQIQFAEMKPEFKDWKQATNWSFRMEIPAGGFVGENDEFQFAAPEEGYQSVVRFNFQQGQPNWTTDINTNYYIKFGNPPLYGHLHIQTGISYGGAILTYVINPDGSHNLEPK